MYILYILKKGEWKEYARFDGAEYESQVKKAAAWKKQDGKSETVQNAATVAEQFVCDGKYYAKSCGKTALRALRHFDEVGISNDVHAALEEALDEGLDAFALLKEGAELSSLTEGVFSATV